ncbi:FxSxx-COOH system tetratricopeptide repeat protein [Prosthecobacter sp.]|uniref:FxSxx-COOH system tetratricopeptide repeat protein n=1 Tax=Prosthecobacter sp. TaxID=1965333 RepID=UPI0037837455
MSLKRFRIAFSFAGEKREFVKEVAEVLAGRFGEAAILYDKYHEAEFARNDLSIYLPKLYNKEADLVVVVVCPQYDVKDWTGLEWLAIHDLLKQRRREEVLLSRFERAEVDGLFSGAGFIELDDRTPEEFAKLILERLALNEGLAKNHYTKAEAGGSPAPVLRSAPIPSNLPGGYIGQLFLGREEFLKELRESLMKQTHATAITQQRAATGIEGLGGLGKTHAAVEYAHRHRADYSALLFVGGDSPQRLNAGLANLCEVLGLNAKGDLPPDEALRVSTALHWLGTHRDWLLIVDNVDDEASAQALTGYFDQMTRGHVLITSRLKSFSGQVDPLDLAELREADAAELLLRLTEKRRRKAGDDAAQAGTLAGLLEGLPLALQQAAGYINEQRLTLAQYHATYQAEAATLLEWFDGLRIPYERSDKLAPKPVLITWKASFERLDEEAKFWLLVFSHFAPESIPEFLLEDGPEADDVEKKIHRNAFKALAEAEKISLLTRYDEPPRFKLHRLVQEVTRLSASEEERGKAIEAGIGLIHACDPGNPLDVRSWNQWTPLQPHALALCQHARDEPPPQRLTWLLGQLDCLFDAKGLHAEAEKHSRRALKIEESSFGKEHPTVAARLNNLAALLQATNRLAEAEPLMRRALQIDEASIGKEHPDVARDLNNLASLLKATNRLAEAEPLMRRALQIDEASFGSEHPNVAIDLNNLAQLLQATNRLVEAEPLMRRGLKIEETSKGLNHPHVAIQLNNLAQLLQATNRLVEAEILLIRVVKILEHKGGEPLANYSAALNNLASLLYATNRLKEAEPLMRRALQIDEASLGPEHPKVAIDLNNLAQLLQDTNRLAEAEPLMRRALQIDEASFGPEHPNVAIRLNNLAQLLKATNRLAEAEPLMRRAFGIFVRSLGVEHPNSQRVGGNYIDLLRKMGVAEEEMGERVRSVLAAEAE